MTVRYRPMILKRGRSKKCGKSGNLNSVLWTPESNKYLKMLWKSGVTQTAISKIFGISSHSTALAPRIKYLGLKDRSVSKEEHQTQYQKRQAQKECPSFTPNEDVAARLDILMAGRLFGN